MHGSAAACAMCVGVGSVAYAASREPSERPLFRFGVIADIQYCDCDDATNFAGTEVRRYRGTLSQTRSAVSLWNSLADLRFVIQLGDLIDGQNAGKYGAGLGFMSSGAGPQSEAALSRVTAELAGCKAPIFHAVGNHELYNFDWAGLRERLNIPSRGWRIAPPDEAADAAFGGFSWRPAEGWTFMMLNAYAVSIEQPAGLPGHAAAATILQQHNPQCYAAVREGKQGVDFFAGLDEARMRYVPFNGGVGRAQLRWLREQLAAARARGDRVVLLSHLPMYAPAASVRTLMYDADEVMDAVREEGRGAVVAVFAGHLHRGGYAVDAQGVHHVTVQSPLNFDECFGWCDVYADKMDIVGRGGLPSRSLTFPPRSAL